MDADSFRTVVLRYFAASCAGAAFAVAAVLKQEPGIQNMEDFLKALYQHHFASLLIVNTCYMVALGIYLAMHTLFLGGRVVAFQDRTVLEKLVNFFSSKFVFLGLVFEVPFEDMLYWLVWFAIIGLFKVLISSAQSKFEQHIATASTVVPFVRGAALLGVTLVANTVIFLLIAPSLFGSEWSAAALLVYDLTCVFLEAWPPLYKYTLQVLDQYADTQRLSERLSQYTPIVEVISDLCLHVSNLMYLLLVWRLCGIAYFVKDIVLTMHIHNAITQLRRRWQAYTTLRSLHSALQTIFPDADENDPQTRDMCAICLKPLENSKKLPCGHCLHANCIADMVRRQGHRAQTHAIKCPLCRKCVDARTGELLPDESDAQRPPQPGAAGHREDQLPPSHIRSFFRFSTIEWPRWIPIPGFSVEVLQRPEAAPAFVQPGTVGRVPPDVEAIVNNLSDMFPDVPRQLVLQDILRTRNVHLTTDNILNARPPFDVQSLTAFAVEMSEATTGGSGTEEPAATAATSDEPIPAPREEPDSQLPTMQRYQHSVEQVGEDRSERPVAMELQSPADERELRRRRALEAAEKRWARDNA